MLKHLTGLFNTSKMQFKTEVLSSEDQFMQDKFSQISNAPISTCTENLSNFTNSIMRDVSTQFIQKFQTKFQNFHYYLSNHKKLL